MLATFAAPFDPASTAATPNLVDPEDLPAANALNGSLWGTMLAVGAGSAAISAAFGADTAFLVDAGSFVVSAALLAIRRSLSERRDARGASGDRRVDARDVAIRAPGPSGALLLAVKFGFRAAAGLLALIPVMALSVFDSATSASGF